VHQGVREPSLPAGAGKIWFFFFAEGLLYLKARDGDFVRSRHSRLRLCGGKLRRESRKTRKHRIPAFAGMTTIVFSNFFEFIRANPESVISGVTLKAETVDDALVKRCRRRRPWIKKKGRHVLTAGWR
jgi:hypothetical protein